MALLVGVLGACGGEPEEAPRVPLTVGVDGSAARTVTTDLGYDLELETAQLALSDIEFTVAGEVHARSLFERVERALFARALAHPGHYQGGEVTGELPGTYVVDWLAHEGDELGEATLIAGAYKAVNFTLVRATDALSGADAPLLGHTAFFRGRATKAGITTRFQAFVDSPENRQVVGVPFEARVTAEGAARAALLLVLRDAHEDDTLFDGIDFAALPTADDGLVTIGPDAADSALTAAYELLRRTLQTHDHFEMKLE